ncbi:hypothetical protein V8G54_000352 [Vigna mungo]|uniref:Uncharacterized protein n=1 Tax=Vigna mungo TaxID=3915 RepID=A0AAQ3P5B3_VIGMU
MSSACRLNIETYQSRPNDEIGLKVETIDPKQMLRKVDPKWPKLMIEMSCPKTKVEIGLTELAKPTLTEIQPDFNQVGFVGIDQISAESVSTKFQLVEIRLNSTELSRSCPKFSRIAQFNPSQILTKFDRVWFNTNLVEFGKVSLKCIRSRRLTHAKDLDVNEVGSSMEGFVTMPVRYPDLFQVPIRMSISWDQRGEDVVNGEEVKALSMAKRLSVTMVVGHRKTTKAKAEHKLPKGRREPWCRQRFGDLRREPLHATTPMTGRQRRHKLRQQRRRGEQRERQRLANKEGSCVGLPQAVVDKKKEPYPASRRADERTLIAVTREFGGAYRVLGEPTDLAPKTEFAYDSTRAMFVGTLSDAMRWLASFDERKLWGCLFLSIGSIFFLGFFFVAVISKLLPPSHVPLISALQNDW